MRLYYLSFFLLIAVTSVNCYSKTLNVKDFGAKGDGTSDDYAALKAAAVAICREPGGTLYFPPGQYNIVRYRITGGINRSSVTDIIYSGCQNVAITGNGVTIDVFGAFYRAPDLVQGNLAASYEDSVTPFRMVHSNGFTISGFTILGNVQKMTRDSRVTEGNSAGITTTDCHDFTLQDIRVSGFPTDGITLGANSVVADTNATLSNVVSTNNGRQGISILQVNQALISQSTFANTGRTGAYGGHLPMAGADVEPLRAPPQEDLATTAIVFDRCSFSENMGFQFVSEVPALVGSVTVQNSKVSATLPDEQAGAFMNAASNALVRNTEFFLSAGHAVELGPDSLPHYAYLKSSSFVSNTLHLAAKTGLWSPMNLTSVRLEDNRVIVSGGPLDTQMMMVQNIQSSARNQFFVSGAYFVGTRGTLAYQVVYQNVANISGNSYATDLSNGTFNVVYYGPGLTPRSELYDAHWKPLTIAR